MDAGDVVVALEDGGHDKDGFPRQRPLKGRTYRLTGIYTMPYGLGCTLEGLDPFPYRGYFLMRAKGKKQRWYFEKLQPADDEFTAMMQALLRKSA
jgi:hypothetical protein